MAQKSGRRRKTEAKIETVDRRGWMTGAKSRWNQTSDIASALNKKIRPIKFRSRRDREKGERRDGQRNRKSNYRGASKEAVIESLTMVL